MKDATVSGIVSCGVDRGGFAVGNHDRLMWLILVLVLVLLLGAVMIMRMTMMMMIIMIMDKTSAVTHP